jgi:hypothetical protein
MTEILLKVALNTINLNQTIKIQVYKKYKECLSTVLWYTTSTQSKIHALYINYLYYTLRLYFPYLLCWRADPYNSI